MSYLGRQPQAGKFDKLDDISGSFNGVTTSFSLTKNGAPINVFSAEQLLVSIGGVIQEPVTDFTITGLNAIQFTTAPESSDTFFAVQYGDTLQAMTPMDNSVTGSSLAATINASGKTFKNATMADSLTVTANTTFSTGSVTLSGATAITGQANVGAVLTVDSGVSNTNIFSDHLNITANTTINGVEPIGTGRAVAMTIVFG